MAHSNYKVLTDVDLSNNQLLNVSRIENTEEASKSLSIKTNGDTILEVANLTGNVATGTTSLTTKNSEVTVTGTAIETVTTSKTTTVATTTTETVDSSGIVIKTPSQTVVASGKSETISSSVTLATGPLDPDDRSELASITLTKVADINKGPKVATSAKTIAVDATDTITQTASTSTYRADAGDVNSLKLTTDDVKLKSDNEAITLTKAKDGAAAKTEIHSNNLVVNATAVEVKENTTTSIKASNSVSVGVGSRDPSPTTIGATASNIAIKSNKVTITGENATEAIKLVAGSTSVSVEPQKVTLDSDGELSLKSDEGVAINDLKSATITAPIISEKASTRSEVKSPSITLVTGPFIDSDSTKQASLTLTKTPSTDNSAITASAKEVIVDANVTGGSIVQTAPTSTYKTSEDNKIVLDNTGITLTNNSEVAKLGNGMTSVAGTELNVTTTTVNINHTGTNTISANDIRLHTKGNNPASSLDISSGETTLKSPKVTLNGTGSEGVTVKSGDNSSSVAVKSTTVKIDSKGTLDISANGNISIDNPRFTIDIDTKDVLEKATVSSTVRSPKITLVTGTPEGTGNNKQAKITLTKTPGTDDSTINSSAKTVEVDASVTGGSITQTAPTSTYKTSDSNKIVLNSEGISLTNNSEIVKLGSNQTSIAGTRLGVSATAVNINNSTTDVTSADGITAKTDAGSELKILTNGATLKSPKVTLNGTGDGVEAKSGNSSVNIKKTAVNINSDGTLTIFADEGIEINDDASVSTIAPSISETATNGTISNTAGTITLTTNKPSGDNAGNSTLMIDGNTSTLNTSSSTVAATTITQTAPTSTYKADGNNKLELGTGSAKITSGTETITLVKAKDGTAAKTTISSSDLIASATKVTIENNTSTSVTSSESVIVKASSGAGTSTVTTKPVEIELKSKKVSLAASVTENNVEKSSSITLSPAALAEEIALSLNTDKNLKISSVKGATIEDNKSIDLKALDVTETASNSANVYSRNIKLWNAKDSATEKITLNNTSHTISITANNAGVDIEGNTPDTVTIKGTEFKVNSGKSTFAENSKFNKNVEVVGSLTTSNMTGEAATLNSLDVKATTTVNGTLSTGTASFTSINGADATLEQKLTVEGETTIGEGGATIGTLTVNDGATLTAEAGMTARKAVTVGGTTKVNGTATVGVLKVSNGETLEAQKGLTSKELVEVNEKTTVNGTATIGNLSVPNGQTFTAVKGVLANESVTVNNTTTAGTLDVTGTLAANSGLTSKGLVSVENKSSDPTALTVNNTATTGILTVGGTLKTTTGGVTSAGLVEIVGTSPDGKSLTVSDTATTGILTVGGTLKTTTGGVTSAGLVDILNTSNRDKALTVSDIATTGTLTVAGDLKTTTNGVTSAGLVSIENKKSAATALTISDTATTNTLTVTGDLGAGKGLKSAGLVSIENKKSAATALTVSNTATTGTLTVTGDLSAGKGLKSAGLVDITGKSADGKSLIVSKTATTNTLTISDSTLEAKGGLTATGEVSVGNLTASTATVNNLSIPSTSTLEATTKMTSGTVTVTGETSIATITGKGSLKIPEATLIATNGGTTGSVNVSNIEIKTIMGDGSLEIPPTGTLIADKGGKATTKFEPANIEIKTVMGGGSLKIPETTTLEAVKGGKATEKFEPANVEIATVTGEGSLTIPGNQTLTAMKGGTINGSMTIGKSNSTSTNLELYGNATIGTSGTSDTILKSYAKIDAKSTLEVAEKATFSKNAEVAGDFILDGVTIRWDSTLGALIFSKG